MAAGKSARPKIYPDVSVRRRIDPLPGLAVLEEVTNIVESVDQRLYEDSETVARMRKLFPPQAGVPIED
jgi:hypothetical protein